MGCQPEWMCQTCHPRPLLANLEVPRHHQDPGRNHLRPAYVFTSKDLGNLNLNEVEDEAQLGRCLSTYQCGNSVTELRYSCATPDRNLENF